MTTNGDVGSGWQIVGPPEGAEGEWRWSASADYGRRSEGGRAATRDEARQLAEDAYRRLNP